MTDQAKISRRQLLLGLATLPITGVAGASIATPDAAEGPFYPTPTMRFDDIDNNLVKITSQVKAAGGEVIELAGQVLDKAGNPIVGARVEIWQCDVNGRYLHRGDSGGKPRDPAFQGFGHDLTSTDGSYYFRTIKPVSYPGRTPHIHVKVLVENQERLTTQFYLPDHSENARDWLYQQIPQSSRDLVTMHFDTTLSTPQAILNIII